MNHYISIGGNFVILFLTRANASFVNQHNKFSAINLLKRNILKLKLKEKNASNGFAFKKKISKLVLKLKKQRLGVAERVSGRLKIKLTFCC